MLCPVLKPFAVLLSPLAVYAKPGFSAQATDALPLVHLLPKGVILEILLPQ